MEKLPGMDEKAEDIDTAQMAIDLIARIKCYKNKNFDKKFKINALGPGPMSERQFHIIYLIQNLKLNTLSQISGLLNLSPGSLSTIISKMVKNGLIYKEYPTGTEDKRKTYFCVTEEGAAMFRRYVELFKKETARFYGSLCPAHKKLFKAAYERLVVFVPDYSLLHIDEPCHDEARQIAEKIVSAMIGVSNFMEKYYDRGFDTAFTIKRNFSVSPSQFLIMFFLSADEINSAENLSNVIGISRSTLSTALSKLESAGFLVKERPLSDGDERKVFFRLTDKGVIEFNNVRSHITTCFLFHLNKLQREEKEGVRQALINLSIIFKEVSYEI